MILYYNVDRFEGEYAVLEDRATNEMINIERKLLPNETKEGDILKLENDSYTIDYEEMKKVKEAIKEKINRLWKKRK